ncbi:MAG: winged helix-turn-helix domain-containing protein [Pseudomonadota bacterium]
MAIPDFQTLMRPVLEFAATADERAMKETHPVLADLFNLSEEEREHLLPSGRVGLFHNRVAWAVTHHELPPLSGCAVRRGFACALASF